jgi:hypothetical protein
MEKKREKTASTHLGTLRVFVCVCACCCANNGCERRATSAPSHTARGNRQRTLSNFIMGNAEAAKESSPHRITASVFCLQNIKHRSEKGKHKKEEKGRQRNRERAPSTTDKHARQQTRLPLSLRKRGIYYIEYNEDEKERGKT